MSKPFPAGSAPANGLANETSPYLRQHAHNPVNWQPWGPAALARARAEDKPIFLSVGYSACHWCHVMAHESFEDAEVARVLNAGFVCVKVDREERPDLDEIYMTATQLVTGRGGWPNSVWLTPDGRPWFAGTYFPRDDRPGMTGFLTLCGRLAEIWSTRRAEVERQADTLAEAVRGAGAAAAPVAPGDGEPEPRALVAAVVAHLRASFDKVHGGFGEAPKFPPHGELALLLAEQRRAGEPVLSALAAGTLGGMARGGLHDQVGGGFHRYSTDAHWFLPHFEKMLSDNARLLTVYAGAWQLTKNEDYAEAARGIVAWVRREMIAPDGGFFVALDADSEGEEGRFYVWTHAELFETLGPDDGAFAARAFNAVPEGNARDEATGRQLGTNVLHLAKPISELAAGEGTVVENFRARLDRCRAGLLAARGRRVRPGLDDKILASWNGLMIGALAQAGATMGEKEWLDAAERAAEFVWTRQRPAGRLHRVFAQGRATIPAFLDDHAFFADGLLDLHEALGGQGPWLERAVELAVDMIERFRDEKRGGFFLTAADHEDLLARPKDPFDQAVPSGNAVAYRVLRRLHALTGSELYRVTADETVRAFAGLLRRMPRAAPTFVLALSVYGGATSPAPPPVPGCSGGVCTPPAGDEPCAW